MNANKFSASRLLTASALTLLAFAVQADSYAPADTFVQEYKGDYPLAVTEPMGTFSESEVSAYPEATTVPDNAEMATGYETAVSDSAEPRDAFYSENVGYTPESGSIVNVPASYSSDVPIFVNDSVSSSVALDNATMLDRDAPAGYYAQFGAFGKLDNALRLRSRLTTQLGTSVIVVEEGGLYKVQAGPLETADRAFSMQSSSADKIRVIHR